MRSIGEFCKTDERTLNDCPTHENTMKNWSHDVSKTENHNTETNPKNQAQVRSRNEHVVWETILTHEKWFNCSQVMTVGVLARNPRVRSESFFQKFSE